MYRTEEGLKIFTVGDSLSPGKVLKSEPRHLAQGKE
jgi:hypothetical protein